MLWIEIKKNTFSIIFLIAVILTAGFTFFSISPEIEYYYSKPLSSGEYMYFKLKEDMRGNSLLVYDGEEGNGVPADLEITEDIRNKIRDILLKINPLYDESEKMSEVKIKLTDEEILELVREFESTISYRTNYHYGEKSGLYSVYKFKRFGINKANEDSRNTITKERADFENLRQTGLSEGYARYFINYLGIITGLMSVILSAVIFSKDKQSNISDFIYTLDFQGKCNTV